MKKFLLPFLVILSANASKASDKDSTIRYELPDSIKAIQFLAEIKVLAINTQEEVFAGIKTDLVKLSLESDKKEHTVVFEFPDSATVIARGLKTDAGEKGEIEWKYDWVINENYKLLVATANDSASNVSIYSGYIWLPKEKKWKLIGTCKIKGRWNTIQAPASFYTEAKKGNISVSTGQVWCMRRNGTWKNLTNETQPVPFVNLTGHLDSAEQRQKDSQLIGEAIASGNSDAMEMTDDVYYKIMKEGTGKTISVTDTLVVHYKGYLLRDGSVFDQTQDKPATFPLKRLIKGWQIGVPLCRVGGKIKLVIPSALAYSVRTITPDIPPNSILVFEIEVLDAKTLL